MEHCCRPVRNAHWPRIEPEYCEHLRRHPELAWQEELRRDMPAQPWTTFQIQ